MCYAHGMSFEIFVPIETVPKSYVSVRRGIALTDKCRIYHMECTNFLKRHAPKIPMDGDLEISVIFFLKRLPSQKNMWYPNTKPDHDNLTKSLQDCLELAQIIQNDSRIVKATIRKVFVGGRGSRGTLQPGALVKLKQFEENDESLK